MMNKIFLTSRIWPDSDLRSFGCQGQWEKRILKNCQGYIFGTERQMIPVTGVETNFLCHYSPSGLNIGYNFNQSTNK